MSEVWRAQARRRSSNRTRIENSLEMERQRGMRGREEGEKGGEFTSSDQVADGNRNASRHDCWSVIMFATSSSVASEQEKRSQ